MKLDAVGVTTSNMRVTIEFYKLLGFEFDEITADAGHVEPITPEGSARLMIDTVDIVKEIISENPTPGNHSSFAIRYDSSSEVDNVTEKIKSAGFKVVKVPWDAFWGQRYAVVEDPDGYKVDLYADLDNK
jgi:uncharacterized glyoxalase superfamily protein PhnB